MERKMNKELLEAEISKTFEEEGIVNSARLIYIKGFTNGIRFAIENQPKSSTNQAIDKICPGCGGTGKVTKPYMTSTNCIQCGGSGKQHHS